MTNKLTPQQIKKKIDDYNKQIEENFYPHKFTLNNEITEITNNIKALQAQCPHEFENGYCKFCYISEEIN